MENSEQLKQRILGIPAGEDDGGMGPSSPGGYPEELHVEEEEEEIQATEEGEEEDKDVVEYLETYEQTKERERLEGMDASARSTYNRTKKIVQQQQLAEIQNAFANDVKEFASKYSAFPEILSEFGSDFQWGNFGVQLDDEEAASCECPQEELFMKMAEQQS